MIDKTIDGNLAAAREIHYSLLPLFNGLFVDTNPIPVKYALSKMGLMEESYRLPLCQMDAGNKKHLDEVLENLGIE